MQSPSFLKVIISCYLASFLEIYDFMLFGFFAPILHKNYLSFLDANTALIITYAFFAVGFIFRPLGSLIFGYIGDVYGRKSALVLSVSLMGTSSLMMFLLPTYEQIGILSCFIIALVRILQGISVGGEFTGAIIYAIEHNEGRNAGLIGGIVSAGGASGILLATIVSKFVQNPVLPDYSWRFAFLVGFALSIIGYIVRKQLTETPIFRQQVKRKLKFPLMEGFKLYKIECFATFFTAAANGISFYFVVVFLSNFLKTSVLFNIDFIQTMIVWILIIFTPLFGWLSDRIGRVRVIIISTISAILYGFIALDLMVNAASLLELTIYVLIYTILVASFVGTVNVFVVEIFPPAARMSSCSLFYSLGMGFIGGTFPMVAASIVQWFGNDRLYLGGYISIVSIFALVSVILVRCKHATKHHNVKTL